MKPENKKTDGGASMTMVARYLGLAFLLPLTAGAGWMVGSFLDRSLHVGYWSIICLILGIVGGFIQLLRELLRDAGKS